MKSLTKTKKLTSVLLALAIMVTTAFACGFSFTSKSANADTVDTDTAPSSYLGKTINAAKSEFLDYSQIKTCNSIFNDSWIKSQKNSIEKYMRNTAIYDSDGTYASSFTELEKSYSNSVNFDATYKGSGMFSAASLQFGFKDDKLSKHSNYSNNFYYICNGRIECFSLSLPNYQMNLSSYIANLNPYYLNCLDRLFSGSMTFTEFFDTFGTHVIMKGVYGGSVNFCYSVSSNSYDVGGKYSSAIASSLSLAVGGVEASVGGTHSTQKILNCGAEDILENSNCYSCGGEPFGYINHTNIEKFYEYYNSWSSSVKSNPSLIGMDDDGLVALSDLLPQKYSSQRGLFSINLYNYASNYQQQLLSKYNNSYTQKREWEAEISDKGPMKEDVDVFKWVDYPFSTLKSKGYNYATVTVTLDMKEKHEGNQQVFLYPRGSTNYNDKFAEISIEFGGSGRDKNYRTVSFNFESISIDKFLSGLEIRYGATGFGEDTWYNQNVYITVTVSKNATRASRYSKGDKW